MNNNDLLKDGIIIPFRPKMKEFPEVAPQYITLEEFHDETYERLQNLEELTLMNYEIIKELEMKIRVTWFASCIGFGILIGSILNYLVKLIK